MLDIIKKLEILGAAAKYDVSCASSGNGREGKKGSIGNTVSAGLCHTFTEDGRCVSLLKVLLSNACVYDCAYCINRRSNDIPRASFTPDELALLTIEFYKRNYIEGLFLSSAVIKSPDYTMELIIKALEILRNQYRFRGYIHAKIIPGANSFLIEKTGQLADRVSVNIEFATKSSLKLLADNKSHTDIISPMTFIKEKRLESRDNSKFKTVSRFAPAGQSTQLIVGATPERDLTLLKLTDGLYNKFNLKRVYYSAYMPVAENPYLPALKTMPPLLREHRLYQADWLLRVYKFSLNDILDEKTPDLDLEFDPKVMYAFKNPFLFPVDVNKASFEMLIRVPGIGILSAKRIISARRFSALTEEGLKKTGVVLKRARHFLIVNGKFLGKHSFGSPFFKELLRENTLDVQQSLFDFITPDYKTKQNDLIFYGKEHENEHENAVISL